MATISRRREPGFQFRTSIREPSTSSTSSVVYKGGFQLLMIVGCCLFAIWLWYYTSKEIVSYRGANDQLQDRPKSVPPEPDKSAVTESNEDIQFGSSRHHSEMEGEPSGSWSRFMWIMGGLLLFLLVILVFVLIILTFVAYVAQVVVFNMLFAVLFVIIAIPVKIFTGKDMKFEAPPLPPFPGWRVVLDVGGLLVFGIVDAIRRVLSGFHNDTSRRNTGHQRQRTHNQTSRPGGGFFRLGLRERVTGNYFACKKCTVVWNQEDLVEVGGLTVITIKLTCANGKPYCLQPSDEFTCKVTKSIGKTTLICVVEPAELTGVSEVKVTYTARAVGKYCIKLTVNDLNIGDSPYERTYLPGPADCSKTIVLSNSNTMVARRGVYNAVSVEAKDAHGNSTVMDLPKLDMVVTQNESDQFALETDLVRSQQDEEYELLFKLEQDGIYFGKVMYESKMVGTEGFTIICLDESAVDLVEKQVQKRELNNWYEARLLAQEPSEKGRKVYCYITPRQLQVREYFLKFIPKRRVYTCRVCPSTKIHFLQGNAFCIDDGYQEPITLVSEERGVIGATFSKYMLKNIGGSENFLSKRSFFYKEVSSLGSSSRRAVKIKVLRSDLFHTGYRALKGFSTSDWRSTLDVSFIGEYGLDWGGVRREFFTLLCCELFESSGLFTRFSEDHQALVHPNPNRPSSLKLKYYEFCGKVIGKCLYDSALGDIILVKARFTRSFLAQIIGLRVNYRYFETDDPELYTTKVKYVKESDVSDLELMFAEEVFSHSTGSVTEVVSLKPGGASIEVTNENKMEYLNCLAQYRLVYRVKDEIEAFLKGLNEIIPDNLLSIFDENELELLMCGMSKIDVSDWKAHSTVNGHNAHFLTMVTWFWTVVTNYNQEERTRLLQFVTGSSQLPSEGFSELNPKFTISHAPVPGRLPSAHTCFNEICLSDHTTYESFESSLRIAITEGSEGFGMA